MEEAIRFVSIVFCVFMMRLPLSCQRRSQSRVNCLVGDRSDVATWIMEGLGRTEVGSEPSGNGDFAPVGITPIVVAKKLHMPAVNGPLVRARGVATRASETAARLLKQSVGRLRSVAAAVAAAFSEMEDGMESFWDRDDRGAHVAFVKWLDENPDGFVINCRTANDMMLHRSSCSAVIFDDPVSLTRKRKVCSSDREQLERWAKKHGGEPLRYCKMCSPRT